MSVAPDLKNKIFSSLKVIERAENDRFGQAMWLCECVCGRKTKVRAGALRKGIVKSCGCLRNKSGYRRSKRSAWTKHQNNNLEYNSWLNMIQRCENPNHSAYKYYGKRGISVCKRWSHSFKNFFEDMGRRPNKLFTLDRLDSNKGYFPENCRWASRREQGENKRGVRKITYKGITLNVSSWARKIGINRFTLISRLQHGWSIEEALNPKLKK